MHKLFYFPAFLVLLTAGLAGCSTDGMTGRTEVSGQVLTQAGRQPVPGATVEVVDATGGANSPIGVETTTGPDGRFSFSFDAQKKAGYALMAYTPLGHFTPNSAAQQLTSGRRNADMVISVKSPAWVRIHVVDEPPRIQAEVFMYGYGGGGEPGGQSDRLRFPRDTVLVSLFRVSPPVVFYAAAGR